MPFSYQYQTAYTRVNMDKETADEIIQRARDDESIFYEDGPDDECFVLDVGRGVGPELYTEEAIRRSTTN